MYNQQNYWRDSAREVKFFMFDGKLSIMFVILLFNFEKIWLYFIFFILLGFFSYLNYIGFNLSNFTRLIGAKIVGEKAYGKPKWFRRSYF